MQASRTRRIVGLSRTARISKSDQLAVEEPLEIRIDSRPVSITMRTPGSDAELAVGFAVSEGLLRRRADLLRIASNPRNETGNSIDLFLHPDTPVDFAQLTRHVFASSSCGICGKATIEEVLKKFPKIKSRLVLAPEILYSLEPKLRKAQHAFDETGGLHAAGLFDFEGKLLVVREDVGRHNAVDKVIGWGFLNGLWPLGDQILMVSGRASFEIVQKALAASIPIVAAVSAPSTLAVEFAQRNRQTLVGFLRGRKCNIYAGAQRIRKPRSIGS